MNSWLIIEARCSSRLIPQRCKAVTRTSSICSKSLKAIEILISNSKAQLRIRRSSFRKQNLWRRNHIRTRPWAKMTTKMMWLTSSPGWWANHQSVLNQALCLNFQVTCSTITNANTQIINHLGIMNSHQISKSKEKRIPHQTYWLNHPVGGSFQIKFMSLILTPSQTTLSQCFSRSIKARVGWGTSHPLRGLKSKSRFHTSRQMRRWKGTAS